MRLSRIAGGEVETYPLTDAKQDGVPFAFEIENAYISLKAIASLL
jgi:hypothetical protein